MAWDETYQFKKGKSRSKRYNPTPPSPKRKKMNQDARLARMKTLEDDIKNIKDRVSYKEKRRQVAEDMKNYRICDEITEEIGTLLKECRQLSIELKLLTKKDKNSRMYYQRKSTSKSPLQSSSSRSVTCSPPNSDSDGDGEARNVSGDTVILSGNSSDHEDSDLNL